MRSKLPTEKDVKLYHLCHEIASDHNVIYINGHRRTLIYGSIDKMWSNLIEKVNQGGMGLGRSLVMEVFMACDNNEDQSVNYLLDPVDVD
ncbi:hypothetical protein L6452_13437 [Arctium lappa]|uniref:Uncharacterized protein n=1 Tax=Arctium lappa TaxID=4217 RepID=A0ACB9CIA0_ARCLA|nr:hypothetical protein L6452_13437 [Arctium lappa]